MSKIVHLLVFRNIFYIIINIYNNVFWGSFNTEHFFCYFREKKIDTDTRQKKCVKKAKVHNRFVTEILFATLGNISH